MQAASRSPKTCHWSDYISALLDKGYVSRCAIYSTKGRHWAVSGPDFVIDQEQFDAIMQGFQDDAELRILGLKLADVGFTLTRLTNRNCMMTGRCSATGSGCIIYKCRRCVIMAMHEDPVPFGACYAAVERLGDFLLDQGY